MSTRNLKASAVARWAFDVRTRTSASATCGCGSALWCRRRTLFFGSAAEIASPAGLSSRSPCAATHFKTAPIRCRQRLAVSRFVDQIGTRTSMTSAVLMRSTRFAPIFGTA